MGSLREGDTVSLKFASGAARDCIALVMGETSWLGGGLGGGPVGRIGLDVAMLAGRRLRPPWVDEGIVFDSKLSSLLDILGAGSVSGFSVDLLLCFDLHGGL